MTFAQAPIEPTEQITITSNLDAELFHAEQLGHICVAWAQLEWGMYHLFELLSGSPPAIARATFYAIDSTRGRREILLALGSVLFGTSSDQRGLDNILGRVARTSSQRNKYVHDTWGVAHTQKHEVFQMRMSTTGDRQVMEEVTVPDMKNVVTQIRALADELHSFLQMVAPRVPALLEKYRSLPGVALEFVPKGHPRGKPPKGQRGQR
jgi:hypothetical protein